VTTVLLHALPKGHPLRNKPLGEIGANGRHVAHQGWKPMKKWVIGTATFNELGNVWTQYYEFMATNPTA